MAGGFPTPWRLAFPLVPRGVRPSRVIVPRFWLPDRTCDNDTDGVGWHSRVAAERRGRHREGRGGRDDHRYGSRPTRSAARPGAPGRPRGVAGSWTCAARDTLAAGSARTITCGSRPSDAWRDPCRPPGRLRPRPGSAIRSRSAPSAARSRVQNGWWVEGRRRDGRHDSAPSGVVPRRRWTARPLMARIALTRRPTSPASSGPSLRAFSRSRIACSRPASNSG